MHLFISHSNFFFLIESFTLLKNRKYIEKKSSVILKYNRKILQKTN